MEKTSTHNPVYCHDIIDAAREMQNWLPMMDAWAVDAIKRALFNVVEYRSTTDGSDRDDTVPLPPYAIKTVCAAMRHVKTTDARCERELERFTGKPEPIFF